MGTITEQALAQYEQEHEYARQILLPEEGTQALTSMPWQGGYRWFRSANAVYVLRNTVGCERRDAFEESSVWRELLSRQ